MKYNLYLDELVRVWRRTHVTVEANNVKEAVDLCIKGSGDITELEYLTHTEEVIKDDPGPTAEIYTESGELLYTDD